MYIRKIIRDTMNIVIKFIIINSKIVSVYDLMCEELRRYFGALLQIIEQKALILFLVGELDIRIDLLNALSFVSI